MKWSEVGQRMNWVIDVSQSVTCHNAVEFESKENCLDFLKTTGYCDVYRNCFNIP